MQLEEEVTLFIKGSSQFMAGLIVEWYINVRTATLSGAFTVKQQLSFVPLPLSRPFLE